MGIFPGPVRIGQALKKILKDEYGLDPAGDKGKGLAVITVLDAWGACRRRVEEERKVEAEARSPGLPNHLGKAQLNCLVLQQLRRRLQ